MDLGIKNKKAIVCASSKGLGKACAKSLVEEGVSVLINGRTKESLESAYRELSKIDKSDLIILLDDKGKQYSSVDFSKFLQNKMLNSIKRLVFIIGGAYGFSDEVYARANSKISLSKMTFSHQMIRLIFKEQLYRAYTILKGEKYHHE